MEIKLELTVDEVNRILASLAKHPFDEIFVLINKIRQQSVAQLPKEEPQTNENQ